MAFKKRTVYTVVCDVCGYDYYDSTDKVGLSDKTCVEWDIDEDCWHIDETKNPHKHYCYTCWERRDDDTIEVASKLDF